MGRILEAYGDHKAYQYTHNGSTRRRGEREKKRKNFGEIMAKMSGVENNYSK